MRAGRWRKRAIAVPARTAPGRNGGTLTPFQLGTSGNPHRGPDRYLHAADGLSAEVTTTGKLGGTQVSVTDTEPAGGAVVAGLLDVSVVASAAVSAIVTAATPAPR